MALGKAYLKESITKQLPEILLKMLDKIDSPTEYINAISKLLPYSIGKIKPYEDVEEIEPISININFVDTKEEE